MKRFIAILLSAICYLPFASTVYAQSTPYLSDYNFQLDQYRKNYAEYQNFKKDYLAHPTLDNEQKAILSAKQTISSRELAWANFTLVLSDSISSTGVSYPLSDKAKTDLAAIAKYHFGQATAVGSVVTRADLTNFTKNELKVTATHKLALAQAQVAGKLVQLIKFQIDAKTAYDSLFPKLASVTDEVSVRNGLDQIQTSSIRINEQISALAKKTSDLPVDQFSLDQFYSNSSETLIQIRANIARLVDIIIDLDTNYVRH